jgi:nicotinamidase-related amidase
VKEDLNMRRALMVIDVQNEYFTGRLPVSYPKDSLNKIIKVMDAAVKSRIPVIIIQHTAPQKDSSTFVKGSNEWELHDEIKAKKYDYLIEKNLPGSFTNTKLESILRDNQVDTVVICGYMSQMCCDTTSRQAVHLGFSVEFLSDATGTLDISNYAGSVKAEELHKAVLVTQAMRFSKVISTDEWIKTVTQ